MRYPDVSGYIDDVKKNGDSAIRKYTKRFDNIALINLEVTKEQIRKAYDEVDKSQVEVLQEASKSIRAFAVAQMKSVREFELTTGANIVGQKIIPIGKVGCYVPGGRYPLPSSALMTLIPAKVAGVREIIVCSPKIQPATIVAADIAGADRIFSIGGVQAIAAMAYGSESIPKVDKIVGPGNKYVTAAKREVYGDVGIDFIAGPSEILIVADGSANAEFIAADLLAQAEHDTDAKPCLVTTSAKIAEDAKGELLRQLETLETRDVARKALENGFIKIVDSIQEAVDISNEMAPEHLVLVVKDPDSVIPKLTSYGSLFVGGKSAEVFGDYCSGPNHTLPTNGAARYTGGLSVFDFVKIVTYQNLKEVTRFVKIAAKIADIEGLAGHKKSAEIRLI